LHAASEVAAAAASLTGVCLELPQAICVARSDTDGVYWMWFGIGEAEESTAIVDRPSSNAYESAQPTDPETSIPRTAQNIWCRSFNDWIVHIRLQRNRHKI